MIRDLFNRVLIIALLAGSSASSSAQNSLLVNFGTSACTGVAQPSFSLIKNPLSSSPSLLTQCDMSLQLPDIYAVFVAYNPRDNKIYVADIRSGTETRIWVLDMGLPANISCPNVISTTPDYSYSYVSNNFEFDNNGDLWSFSNYVDTLGQCSVDKFDVTTGNVINTRHVNFPAGNFPTSISSGDLTILPNGRMFATLGSFPSKLYEITDYSSTTKDATATFLTTLPDNCFGIAYLNGQLEITGTTFSGSCYYYEYDIATGSLKPAENFQNGQLPIDNTSISPSLGATQQLLSASKVNGNTAELTYEIFVKNLGNVSLNNINVVSDLSSVYGSANISQVTASFAPGSNQAGLFLDPSYNGSSNKSLLLPGQNLPNQIAANKDYFLRVNVGVKVTNVDPSRIYNSSAIASATIGGAGTQSFIDVADSSNNGPETVVDPNSNGNAGEAGENNPTPFNLKTLPVKFISIGASVHEKFDALVKWVVATPALKSDIFQIEYSIDARNWKPVGQVEIKNINQGNYQILHKNIPSGNVFYRIKETDNDGEFIYSEIVLLHNSTGSASFAIYPNPARDFITVLAPAGRGGKTKVLVFDLLGKDIITNYFQGASSIINVGELPEGLYIVRIENETTVSSQKLLIVHP